MQLGPDHRVWPATTPRELIKFLHHSQGVALSQPPPRHPCHSLRHDAEPAGRSLLHRTRPSLIVHRSFLPAPTRRTPRPSHPLCALTASTSSRRLPARPDAPQGPHRRAVTISLRTRGYALRVRLLDMETVPPPTILLAFQNCTTLMICLIAHGTNESTATTWGQVA
jgi:hypothetical protein